ncbi:hypothetical protein C8Q79DRAFT_1014946 [Trametes meyenii]|nr:hypothetical protein C8Q79DRAFT_1014946 [Trametes meyenii]
MDTSESEASWRMCWIIVVVNCPVFFAWHIPRWKTFMMQHFSHNPLCGKYHTLLTIEPLQRLLEKHQQKPKRLVKNAST